MITVEITDVQGKVRMERALIDSGAQENCIRQALAVDCSWEVADKRNVGLATLDGKEVWTYGNYDIDIKATDSEDRTETHRHSFVACDFDGVDANIILGYPWLAAIDPTIGFRRGTWCYPRPERSIEILKPKEFVKYMQKSRVFCLVAKMYGNRLHIGAVTAGGRTDLVPEEFLSYTDVFDASAAGILAEHHPMEHRIDLEPGKEPPWGPIYPLSEPELETLRLYLESAVEKGWIRRSISPAGAPIMFAPKKDGGLRLCVDYRGLNRITVKNRTPLPLMTETFDRLRRAKIYTKIDLKDAYHRLRIRAGDEWKTAFCTRYGHFEYQVVPFGLANAPATFQAYIN